jgi:hypothetical protein
MPIEIKRKDHRNRRAHHVSRKIYHGPLKVPHEVIRLANASPTFVTTMRKRTLRVEYDGTVWLLRKVVGAAYVGEIVETQHGTIRVHCWTALDGASGVTTVADILAAKRDGKTRITEHWQDDRDDPTEQFSRMA